LRPVVWDFWGVPIHGYGLMIVIGFLLALVVTTRLARQRGLPDVLYDLGMVMLLCGIVGGRTFYYLENYRGDFAAKPLWAFFKIWEGGLVFYGGAIGGLVGGFAFLRWKRLPLAAAFDITSVGVPLGMAFGRLGCFLNGCCFGRLCGEEFPLGVRFPDTSAPVEHQIRHGWIDAGDPVAPVHPVQLYQATHDFLLFLLLWWYVGRGKAPRGAGIPLLWVLYGIGRFFLEGLRGDNPSTFSGLTISQNVSIVMASAFAMVLIWLYWRELRSPAGDSENPKKVV